MLFDWIHIFPPWELDRKRSKNTSAKTVGFACITKILHRSIAMWKYDRMTIMITYGIFEYSKKRYRCLKYWSSYLLTCMGEYGIPEKQPKPNLSTCVLLTLYGNTMRSNNFWRSILVCLFACLQYNSVLGQFSVNETTSYEYLEYITLTMCVVSMSP